MGGGPEPAHGEVETMCGAGQPAPHKHCRVGYGMAGLKGRYAALLVVEVILCLISGTASARQQQSVHVDVWLRNEAGDRITPRDNSADPYSPKRTCGACHKYPVITRGYHFRAGSDWEAVSPKLRAFPADLLPRCAAPAGKPGMGLYDRIPEEAARHPGGGPMEPSRPVQEGRESNSGLTPDRHSRFRESGVIEADCLVCHLPGYSLSRRNVQLEARNYRWAATAGAGFGEIRGRIFTGSGGKGNWEFSRRPAVAYHWKAGLFTREGKLDGRGVKKSVSTEACLQCHGPTMAVHTGTRFRPDNDVHVKAGFSCTDCHGLAAGVPGGRTAHHIGRDASQGSPARTGMKDCAACHIRGQYRAARTGMPARAPDPRLVHEDKFAKASFHLRLLHCTACHITERAARGGYLYDASLGSPAWYTAERTDAAGSWEKMSGAARAPWKPWVVAADLRGSRGERYVPAALHTAQWFGERVLGKRIIPLDREIVSRAHAKAGGLSMIRVRDTEGIWIRGQTAASDRDIVKMLTALRDLGKPRAVFVSDKAYELKKGRLVSSGAFPDSTLPLPVFHNVTPLARKQTWGYGGCTDCHGEKSVFFTRMRIRSVGRFLKQDYPVLKGPNAYPQMRDWGFEEVPSHE